MSSETQSTPAQGERPRRIIKRYSNRKLYDTKDSRYVTLAQIAELVRAGEDVQVIDNASKEDKTEATLALIISEEVKSTPKAVPLSTLRDLVHQRGERILSTLREGPMRRLIGTPESEEPAAQAASTELAAQPAAPTPPAATAAPAPAPTTTTSAPAAAPNRTRLQELVESSKQTIDQWQAAIDERIRASLPNFLPAFVRDVEAEIRKLAQRVEKLEQVQPLIQRIEELEQRLRAQHGEGKGEAEKSTKATEPPSDE